METLRFGAEGVDLRLDREELGTLAGALAFSHAELSAARDIDTVLGIDEPSLAKLRDAVGRAYRHARSLDPAAPSLGMPPEFESIAAQIDLCLDGTISMRELYHRLWRVKEWYLCDGPTFDMPADSLQSPDGAFSRAWSSISRALRARDNVDSIRPILESSVREMRRGEGG
jgi:hypothetical protein